MHPVRKFSLTRNSFVDVTIIPITSAMKVIEAREIRSTLAAPFCGAMTKSMKVIKLMITAKKAKRVGRKVEE